MPTDDSRPDPAPTIKSPDRKFVLLRFAVRAVRVTASTIAVVALLRQQFDDSPQLACRASLLTTAPWRRRATT